MSTFEMQYKSDKKWKWTHWSPWSELRVYVSGRAVGDIPTIDSRTRSFLQYPSMGGALFSFVRSLRARRSFGSFSSKQAITIGALILPLPANLAGLLVTYPVRYNELLGVSSLLLANHH